MSTTTPFIDVDLARTTFPGAETNAGLLQAVTTAPVPYGKHGCRHVTLRDPSTRAGGRICIDTADIPVFGISDNGYSQMNAQLSISHTTKTFLRDFQKRLLDLAFENRTAWFPSVDTKEALQKQFTPIFKEGRLKRDGDSWPALMRVTLGPNLFRPDFDELKGKNITCVTVDCSVLYLNSNGRWGVKMVLDSFIVKGAFGSSDEKALYTKFYRTPMNMKKRRVENTETKTPPSSPVKKPRNAIATAGTVKEEEEDLSLLPPMPPLVRMTNDCEGCEGDRPSQKDHMGVHGCLSL